MVPPFTVDDDPFCDYVTKEVIRVAFENCEKYLRLIHTMICDAIWCFHGKHLIPFSYFPSPLTVSQGHGNYGIYVQP
jgi:hypothetical protein